MKVYQDLRVLTPLGGAGKTEVGQMEDRGAHTYGLHSGHLSQPHFLPPIKMLLEAAVQAVGSINIALLPTLRIQTGQEANTVLTADLLEHCMESDWQFSFGLNLQELRDSVTQSHFSFGPYRDIKCFIFSQKSLKL